jgi:hypothetical protein
MDVALGSDCTGKALVAVGAHVWAAALNVRQIVRSAGATSARTHADLVMKLLLFYD